MKTVRSLFVVISICFLVSFVTQVWSAEPVQIQKQKTLPAQTIGGVVSIGMCSVSGTVKLDPKDKTNGYLHYKGPVTFKALKDLKGTNLYFKDPIYGCTCVTCPSGSSHATGLKPDGTFKANESRTYNIDCPAWQQPISGPQGTGKIEYFVETTPPGTSPPGGVFKWSNCAGKFNFTQ